MIICLNGEGKKELRKGKIGSLTILLGCIVKVCPLHLLTTIIVTLLLYNVWMKEG
jgi:hypothetical protein